MKFHPTKAFFIPVTTLVFLLSLSSCGKDYDLVSEYVVRDKIEFNIMNEDADIQNSGVSVMNNEIIKEVN